MRIQASPLLRTQLYRSAIVSALLISHVTLLTLESFRDSPTWDEVGHFAAGLDFWQTGKVRLYIVNPPLVRVIATAPLELFLTNPQVDQYLRPIPKFPGSRGEFIAGSDLADAIGSAYFFRMSIARLACIPFSVFAGIICFLWSSRIWGYWSGVISLSLWCFSPSIMGYGHLITPDMGATSLGLFSAFMLRGWLRESNWRNTLSTSIAVGLANLCKTTLLLWVILWPLLWGLNRFAERTGHSRRIFPDLAKISVGLCGVLFIINVGFGFEGSFRKLGTYEFVSRTLRGDDVQGSFRGIQYGNRFRQTIASILPVPLPSSYLSGLDLQKRDFENGLWSYLRGKWQPRGWWYYYLYAVLIKEPLATIALLVISVGVIAFRQEYRADLVDELLISSALLGFFIFVSSQTGFSHHLRYVLPCFPFMIISISRVGRSAALRHHTVTLATACLLFFTVGSGLSVFPHSLSFYNKVGGGPYGGSWALGNSNSDWGQDLLYLRRWYEDHQAARPLFLGYDLPLIDPRLAGIDWRPLPAMRSEGNQAAAPSQPLTAGWYAISVNQLHDRFHRYEYFNELTPIGWVGYTMPIYYVSTDDARRLRLKYGLP